jgi:type VI secretion system secreted protein VgrG
MSASFISAKYDVNAIMRSHTPPLPAAVDTESNHADVIFGMHSNNFDCGGSNRWVLDNAGRQ